MDSGNSSLQSSSGGNEEFDSRAFFATATSTAATINTTPNNNIANNPSINNHYYANSTNNNNNNLAFFDSLPFFDTSSPFPLLSTSTANPTTTTALSPRAPPENPNPLAPIKTPTPTPTRNSKKRTRASRRAPTTVLTTDTTNFRAMVQEFTGIPAPPFSSSTSAANNPLSLLNNNIMSNNSRPRFDFFNPNSNSSLPFLLKPYPQKLQFPGLDSNSLNYQMPPSSSSSPSAILNFQSLLQSQLGSGQQQASVQLPQASAANEYGTVGVDELGNVIGSGWDREAGADPARLRQPEARGEGMVESWICSSD